MLSENEQLLYDKFSITSSEFESIPDDVRQKIIIGTESLTSEISGLKDKIEKDTIDYEQVLCDYENNIQQLTSDLANQKDILSQWKSDYENIDQKHREMSTGYESLKEKFNQITLEQIDLRRQIGSLESSRDSLDSHLQRCQEEKSALLKERDSLKAESEQFRSSKLELQIKLDELVEKESTFNHRNERWNEEKKHLEKQNDWLDNQLREKSEQVLNCRKDLSAKVLHLQTELDAKTIELNHSRDVTVNLQTTIDKLMKSNETYIDKLKSCHDENVKMEELYQNEIQSQKKLIELYKEKSLNSDSKDKELTTAISELQNLLKIASDDYATLETEKNEIIEMLSNQKQECDETITKLTKELSDANQLMEKFRVKGVSEEELKQMNPSAAVAISALKRGHSLTQIYTDYMQVVEERDEIRLEKARLEEYVKEIMEEMEEKGPSLRRQQEEYFRCRSELNDMSVQMDKSMTEMAKFESQNEDNKRRADHFQRENDMLKQTCRDLSKQIRVLLSENESLRGRPIQPDDLHDSLVSSSTTDGNLMTSSDVIGQHLVTFKSLSELQDQNQKLLQVTRDLSGQLEEKENQGERLRDLRSKVSELSDEVNRIRRSEEQCKQQLDVVVRQRDMFKVLLEQQQGFKDSTAIFAASTGLITSPSGDNSGVLRTPRKSGGVDVSSSPMLHTSAGAGESLAKLEETCEALRELQNEFKEYRECKFESDKVFNTTIEQLRKDNSDLRLLNSRLSSQIEFTNEKFKTLETNVVNYKKEISVLRDLNQSYATNIAKQEADLAKNRQELLSKVDRLSYLEVEVSKLQSKNGSLQAMETRMKEEVEDARRSTHSQRQLMANLLSIKNNLEQRDSAEMHQLTNKVFTAEKESETLRNELDRERNSIADQRRHWTNQLNQLKAELDREKTRANQAEETMREKLREREAEMHSYLSPRKGMLKSSSGSKLPDMPVDETDQIKMLQSKLNELSKEKEGLQMSVNRLTNQMNQYKSISEAVENRLAEQIEITKQLETQIENRASDESERCEFLQGQLDLLEKERQSLVTENIKISEEAHSKSAEVRRDLLQVQHDLQEAISRREEALQLESTAKATIDKYQLEAQEANDKYQRELMLHATDVKALETVKCELAKIQSTNLQSLEEMQSLKSSLELVTNSSNCKEEQWMKEKAEMDSRCKELMQQNDALQDQIFKLNDQVISMKKLTEGTSNITIDNEDIKTSEQLMELVKYLRRQKEIAETSNEMTTSEMERLHRLVNNLERQLNETRVALEEERSQVQVKLETAHQHAELMKKVDQLNLVSESNRLLRQENETLSRSYREMEAKLENLKISIEPLQKKMSQAIDERDTIRADKQSLEEEKERWKERCNKLIETAERMDPELYKKACSERDEFEEKLSKSITEITSRDETIQSLQDAIKEKDDRILAVETQLKEGEQKVKEMEDERNAIKGNFEKQAAELTKNRVTFNQLREVARKYKTEAESLKEENKSKEDFTQMKERAASQLAERDSQLTATKESLAQTNSQLIACRNEVNAMTNQLNSANHLVDEFKMAAENIKNTLQTSDPEDDLTSLSRALQSLVSLIAQHSTDRENFSDHVTSFIEDLESKILRRKVIESQMGKLLKENSELKKNLASAASTSSTPIVPTVQSTASSEPTTTSDDDSQQRISPAPLLSTAASSVRAAAAVVPTQLAVQPTAAVPPTCVSPPSLQPPLQQSRQTAEIRPMPSVATVMPTPAQEQATDQQPSTPMIQMSSVVSMSPTVLPSSTDSTFPDQTRASTPQPSSTAPQIASISSVTPTTRATIEHATTSASAAPVTSTESLELEAQHHQGQVIASRSVTPGSTSQPTVRSGIGKRRREDIATTSAAAAQVAPVSTVEGSYESSQPKRLKSTVAMRHTPVTQTQGEASSTAVTSQEEGQEFLEISESGPDSSLNEEEQPQETIDTAANEAMPDAATEQKEMDVEDEVEEEEDEEDFFEDEEDLVMEDDEEEEEYDEEMDGEVEEEENEEGLDEEEDFEDEEEEDFSEEGEIKDSSHEIIELSSSGDEVGGGESGDPTGDDTRNEEKYVEEEESKDALEEEEAEEEDNKEADQSEEKLLEDEPCEASTSASDSTSYTKPKGELAQSSTKVEKSGEAEAQGESAESAESKRQKIKPIVWSLSGGSPSNAPPPRAGPRPSSSLTGRIFRGSRNTAVRGGATRPQLGRRGRRI